MTTQYSIWLILDLLSQLFQRRSWACAWSTSPAGIRLPHARHSRQRVWMFPYHDKILVLSISLLRLPGHDGDMSTVEKDYNLPAVRTGVRCPAQLNVLPDHTYPRVWADSRSLWLFFCLEAREALVKYRLRCQSICVSFSKTFSSRSNWAACGIRTVVCQSPVAFVQGAR